MHIVLKEIIQSVLGILYVCLQQRKTNINRSASSTPLDLQLPEETYLTIIVNSEGYIGSYYVIEADLAVLWRAVGIQSLHADNPVKQAPLWDRGLVATLDEHWGELIDVVYTDVHGGPEGRRSGW